LSIVSKKSVGILLPSEYSPLERGYWNAAVPSLCVVPLQQHTGSRIEPLVVKGDLVREGMVIAESSRRLAIPLHAPIPGRVVDIGRVKLFDGTFSPALAIELDGEFDRLGKRADPIPWEDDDRADLIERIRAAGVICSPRSSVPAHRYLGARRALTEPIVVLDLSDIEPYMTAGLEVTVTSPVEVLTGLRIAARTAGTENMHVVIGSRARRRLRAFRKYADEVGVRVHYVADRYPGLTEQSVRSLVSRRVARRDVDPDIFIISPATAFSVHDAVVYGKPQIDQVIAVGGSAVRRPAHVRVRIGTSIADVLAECGGLTAEPARIIVGGPLTGQVVTNINAPVTKAVVAVIAMKGDEIRDERQEPCIGCGACVRACPVDLDPRLLHRYIQAGRRDRAVTAGLLTCIECGLCSHVCPSRIPLVREFRMEKLTRENTA